MNYYIRIFLAICGKWSWRLNSETDVTFTFAPDYKVVMRLCFPVLLQQGYLATSAERPNGTAAT